MSYLIKPIARKKEKVKMHTLQIIDRMDSKESIFVF
jgi:hypothetical protein